MGCWDSVVSAYLKRSPAGGWAYFPAAPFGRGYVVEDGGKVRLIRRFLACKLIGIVLTVGLINFVIDDWWWRQLVLLSAILLLEASGFLLARGMPRSPDSYRSLEVAEGRAGSQGEDFWWFIMLVSAVGTTVGYALIATGKHAVGALSLCLCGAAVILSVWMVRRVRTPP